MKTITISVDLNEDDIYLLGIIHEKKSTKKKYVIGRPEHWGKTKLYIKVFQKLVLIEAVHHSRNGYCWLTARGLQALQTAQTACPRLTGV